MTLTTSRPAPSKICLIHAFIQSDINAAVSQTKRMISRERLQYVAKETYQVPDSNACTEALKMVAACSDAFLLNHCLRSYAFGVAMAHKIKQPFDKEVLFLGAIMHDLGLTDEYNGDQSFELDGAIAAQNFCHAHDIDATKSDLIHEMVALHNAVGLAHKLDPEIALLHFGAGADVAGLWIKDVHKDTLREILSEYPRLEFKEGMIKLLESQVSKKPDSYMSTMIDLGFYDKMRKTPF